LLEIDRWVLAKYAECAERIVAAYDDYDYPAIFQAANTFITNDLSAFYIDVTKDRMYTLGAGSLERRSGQTAMFTVVEGVARLLAPVLSVTMDELWRSLPGERAASVHMALFPMGDEVSGYRDDALLERWARLAPVRDLVNLALEEKRREHVIKANLSARVRLQARGEDAALLARYEDFLPTLFGVSQVELSLDGAAEGGAAHWPAVQVERAEGTRCERCWRFVPEVSADPSMLGLCSRCVEALAPAVQH
jgi:isoleucyl-tRNA synthetase